MNAGNNYGFQQLVDLCKQRHQEMQQRAGRSVDIHLVVRNWLFGWYIVEYEQKGCDRAEYGAYLIKRLSEELGDQLGRGVSPRSLEQCRKFYMTQKQIPQTMSAESGMDDNTFPPKGYLMIPQMVSAVSGGKVLKADVWQEVVTGLLNRFCLGWSHYVILLTTENPEERRFYEIESSQNHWSVRELERQIASSLYERLALSRNKDEIRRLAEQGLVVEKAADMIKNPLVLEFLDLEEKPSWSENDLESAGYSEANITRIKQQIDHYLNIRKIIRRASGESLDLKAYEADMRHLIDTYIEAAEPRKISPFDDTPLLELIVKTGIDKAIATQLGGLKSNKNAVAETIENNVRSRIIKEHLNDPAFYEKMSALLDEIIAARKAKAIEYEEYLKRIADLVKKVEAGLEDNTPEALKTSPALRALYNNLQSYSEKSADVAEDSSRYTLSNDPALDLALRIDESVKQVRSDDWRGVEPRERAIKQALYDIVQDVVEVERIFLIIKAQKEY